VGVDGQVEPLARRGSHGSSSSSTWVISPLPCWTLPTCNKSIPSARHTHCQV